MSRARICSFLMHVLTVSMFVCFTCPASPVVAALPYQTDIDRWVAQDAVAPPASGSVLFTGSSSIRRWEMLTRQFNDYQILQRGFGGSQFENLNAFVNDIVLPYNLSAIVVWEGTNDINSGETAGEVFTDYQNFVNLVHTAQPDVDIIYLGIMPTPGRESNRSVEDAVNSSIATMAASNPKLYYIDLPAVFATLNPYDDAAFTSLFDDSIHMNRDGYLFWESVIRPQLEAIVAPNASTTVNPNAMRPGDSLLFDFGPSNPTDGDHTIGPDANGNYWNNWAPAEGGATALAGEHVGNLVDTAGNNTGMTLTITGSFRLNGKVNGGLLSPDPSLLGDLAVASATEDYFFSTGDGLPGGGSDDLAGGFFLEGLDPNVTYDFKFFGSRISLRTPSTEYTVLGDNTGVALIHTGGPDIGSDGVYDGNDDEVAIVSGIRPDAYGKVFVDVHLIEGTYAYLNAMQIIAVPEPATVVLLIGCLGSMIMRR